MLTLIFIIQCSIGAVAFIHREQVSPQNIRRVDNLNKKFYLTNLNQITLKPWQTTMHIFQKM